MKATQLSEDDLHWLAVEIIQKRYKDVATRDIAKIAEKVTEEPIPPGLSLHKIQKLLSKRITAEVRGMGEKAPEPVGHDRLVTVGAKQRSDHSADTHPDSNYGDLTDNRLSKLHLEQNEYRLPEQQQAKAEVKHIKRAASPKCRELFDAILEQGGPGRGEKGDTLNSTAKAIGVDHTTLARCYAEAEKVSDWKIFGEPKEPLSPEDPHRVYRDITSMAAGVAKAVQALPIPMEVIQQTMGTPTISYIGESDKRSSRCRDVPPDEWAAIKARLERGPDQET